MRLNLFLAMGLAAVLFGTACSKAKAPASVDPHSAEAVMQTLLEQGKLLEEALARQDYNYLHDYGYFVVSLAQALYAKLDEQHKGEMAKPVDQLMVLAKQLDRAAGGHRAEATAATVQNLVTLLKDMDAQLRAAKGKG